jgi:Rod binding domain-containing protein
MASGISALLAPSATPADRNDPKKVAAAAGEFEALLIGSLLKSMREAGSSGWLGTGDDKASESLMEIAEQQLSQVLASQGGLGLSRLISQGLVAASTASQDAAQPAPAAAKTNSSGGR